MIEAYTSFPTTLINFARELMLAKMDPYHGAHGRFTSGPNGSLISNEFEPRTRGWIARAIERHVPREMISGVKIVPAMSESREGVQAGTGNILVSQRRVNNRQFAHQGMLLRAYGAHAKKILSGDTTPYRNAQMQGINDALAWERLQPRTTAADREGYDKGRQDLTALRGATRYYEQTAPNSVPFHLVPPAAPPTSAQPVTQAQAGIRTTSVTTTPIPHTVQTTPVRPPAPSTPTASAYEAEINARAGQPAISAHEAARRQAGTPTATLGTPQPAFSPPPQPQVSPTSTRYSELKEKLKDMGIRSKEVEVPAGEELARHGVGWLAPSPDQRLSALAGQQDGAVRLHMALEDARTEIYGASYGSGSSEVALEKEFEKRTKGLDPVVYRQHLLDALEKVAPVKSMTMTVKIASSTQMTVVSTIKTKDATLTLDRTFTSTPSGDVQIVEHNLQKIKSRINPDSKEYNQKVQGGMKGRALMQASEEIYDNMGVQRIDVHAGLDVGGYAWARYGFIPTTSSWDSLRTTIATNLRHLPSNLSPEAEAAKQAIANHITRSGDPKSIRALAALKAEVPIKGPNNKNLTIGQALLTNQDWYGSLDMTKPVDYNVFRSYSEARTNA